MTQPNILGEGRGGEIIIVVFYSIIFWFTTHTQIK